MSNELKLMTGFLTTKIQLTHAMRFVGDLDVKEKESGKSNIAIRFWLGN